MKEYKVSQKIWHIEINKFFEKPSSWSHRQNGIKIEELEIIGISKYRLCLNNDFFTTLDYEREGQRKDRSIYSYPDDINISIRTNDSILGDGVFTSLYSTKKPTKKLLERMAAATSVEIKKKFSFLRGASDDIYEMVDEFEI